MDLTRKKSSVIHTSKSKLTMKFVLSALAFASFQSGATAFTFAAPKKAFTVQTTLIPVRIQVTQLFSEPASDEEDGLDLDLGEMFEM